MRTAGCLLVLITPGLLLVALIAYAVWRIA